MSASFFPGWTLFFICLQQGPDYRLYKSEPELTTVTEVDENNGEDRVEHPPETSGNKGAFMQNNKGRSNADVYQLFLQISSDWDVFLDNVCLIYRVHPILLYFFLTSTFLIPHVRDVLPSWRCPTQN